MRAQGVGCAVSIVAAFGAGCANASPNEIAASKQESVVDTNSPPSSPGVTFAIPPLARQHGRLLSGAPADTSPFAAHGSVFTDGTDLPGGPAFTTSVAASSPSVTCPGSDARCAWIADATSDPFASSSAFAARLADALDDANGELPKLDASTMTGILGVLSFLPGVTTSVGAPTAQFLGYDAESARWLHNVTTRLRPPLGGSTTYADPVVLASMRERGARLYCAARVAQNAHQSASTKSMGKQSAFSFSLFGSTIDVLTVEPTVVLDGPGPFLGLGARCPIASDCPGGPAPNDGAQSFTVPFLFGAQITPISFLPSLPEVRYPVVMMSGDTEVQTDVNSVNNIVVRSNTYRTATHTDALLTEGITGRASASFPIAEIGPVEIDLGFDFRMGVGEQASGSTGGCGLSFSNPGGDSRLLVPPSPNPSPSWPTSTRTGKTSVLFEYADGPWTFGTGTPSNYAADVGLVHGFFVASSNGMPRLGSLAFFDPFLPRALADDDRLSTTLTSLSLQASITGRLGGDIGPLNVSLSATGDLCGTVGLRHTLRDAVITQGGNSNALLALPAVPLSVVSIAPSTFAGATLGFNVHLTISFDVLFGTITIIDADLVNATLPLAQYDTLADPMRDPWSEDHKLRLSTGSSFGNPLKQPFVLSHMPSGGLFAAFPESVDACLASPTPNKPPPGPCASTPAGSSPAQSDICVFDTPAQPGIVPIPPLPPDLCSNVAAYAASLGGTPAQVKCKVDEFTYLCSPASKEQSFASATVIAHTFLTNDSNANASNAAELQAIVDECTQANLPPGSSAADAEAYAKKLFSFGLCDASAALLSPSQIVSGPSDPTQPPSVGAGSCH